MRKPPPLPIEVFDRVMRVARMDGIMILLLAGSYAAMAALAKQGTGLTFGILATAAGAIELHGVEKLRHGVAHGVRWLVASQFYLLAVIVAYATWRLTVIDLELLRQALNQESRQAIAELGLSEDAFLRLTNRLVYGLFLLLSACYQGGMAWYYWSRRHLVARALEEGDSLGADR